MANVRYKKNYAGIGEMINEPWMVADMHVRAERVAAVAESTAPVFETGPHPGRYKAGFRVTSGSHGGLNGDRAFGRVTNAEPESFHAEYGTVNNPAHHTLGAALMAGGG